MRGGRVDESSYEVKKRQPQKPSGIRGGHNHFYVTKKTSISATMKRVEEMLHNKENEVTPFKPMNPISPTVNFKRSSSKGRERGAGTLIYIHGLGASLNRAMVLALEVQKSFGDAISLNITTSTVNVTDDLFPLSDEYEMGIRNRPLSAIQIHICRVQV
ncbi:hypothetical protein Y032_0018g3700 [Ancylostoma ceylanicum]|nr:hypothetical protein Y032_0018g3700 [Ancylostoma ceylanicum]